MPGEFGGPSAEEMGVSPEDMKTGEQREGDRVAQQIKQLEDMNRELQLRHLRLVSETMRKTREDLARVAALPEDERKDFQGRDLGAAGRVALNEQSDQIHRQIEFNNRDIARLREDLAKNKGKA